MRVRPLAAAFIVAGVAGLAAGPAAADRIDGSSHGGRPLLTVLSPGEEVPPHDTAATGTARVTVNVGHSEVCWDISFSDLSAPAIAAHIHQAPQGVNGPVVIPTPVPAEVTGTAHDCAVVDNALARDLNENPDQYYVNVHDSVFPGGEIRGQLG